MEFIVHTQIVLFAGNVVHGFPCLLHGFVTGCGYQPVFGHCFFDFGFDFHLLLEIRLRCGRIIFVRIEGLKNDKLKYSNHHVPLLSTLLETGV